MSISHKIAKSAKGNVYLAVSRWEKGRQVCSVCLFADKPFYTTKATKGEMNLVNDLSSYFAEKHTKNTGLNPVQVGEVSPSYQNSHMFHTFQIVMVEDGQINGVSVGGDGQYFVRNGLAYNISNL